MIQTTAWAVVPKRDLSTIDAMGENEPMLVFETKEQAKGWFLYNRPLSAYWEMSHLGYSHDLVEVRITTE